MSRGKTTRFRGSKLFIETDVSGVTEPITAATAANPATLTVTDTTAKRGDVVTVSGLGESFDGDYVVKSVAADVLTLATDWSDLTVPAPASGTIAVHEFSTNFCELTGITDSGATINQGDVSTICSGLYSDFEPDAIDSGTLQLDFNAAPAQTIQSKLREYEGSLESFWVRVALTNQQGTMLYYGSIQTGAGLTGSTGQSNFTSSVTIKLSGPKFYVSPEA